MEKKLLKVFFAKLKRINFEVWYWDGEKAHYGEQNASPKIKIIFKKALPLNFDLADPILALGEAYMDDYFDIEGNFDVIMKIINANRSLFGKTLVKKDRFFTKSGVKVKQKENIHQHYDLGNDFFSLWLDETMSYSCAYFKNPSDTLFDAQINKIDHILKKLQLKEGETLLDIGCGWGLLLIRAVRNYGVKAKGITISEEQYKEASKRVEELGLSDQIEIKLQDYLELDPKQYQFDKIVSVGMYEHVGKLNQKKYMKKVKELLKPGGLSLLHTISVLKDGGSNSWIDKYIFPGGYLPSFKEIAGILPDYNFHLLHAESLRLHYAKTLDLWYEEYVKHWDWAEERYGRRFCRMWELYLKLCASNFRVGGLDIYQILFSKGLNNKIAMTLEHVWEYPKDCVNLQIDVMVCYRQLGH